ncbi:hypothetical protein L218DRAFT_407151 [Marasmius fiardii PR-910]|nr:hypothetical protein L218DRAFT_407151 [Marasmius fiardii PR-910]
MRNCGYGPEFTRLICSLKEWLTHGYPRAPIFKPSPKDNAVLSTEIGSTSSLNWSSIPIDGRRSRCSAPKAIRQYPRAISTPKLRRLTLYDPLRRNLTPAHWCAFTSCGTLVEDLFRCLKKVQLCHLFQSTTSCLELESCVFTMEKDHTYGTAVVDQNSFV